MTVWPCSTCQAPGFRNVGSRGYCLAHWCALVATFAPESIPDHGLMLPTGTDYGDGWWDCTCRRCGATATMAPGSPCPWCVRGVRERDVHQRQLVLTAPDLPDATDVRYLPALEAWIGRLLRAVESQLISQADADLAVARYDRRSA